MSADDTPTEVNDNLGYVSPNISSGEEEEQEEEELDEAAIEQKKRETVQLDGIPIDEKDIKFKATEIKRKADISYFVNVAEEPEEDPQANAKKSTDAKPAGEKKQFDFKNIAAMIKKPVAAKAENKPKEKVDIVAQLKTIFIDGWHKYITIGVVAAVVIVIGCMIIIPIIEKNSSGADDNGAGEVKIYDNPFDRLEDTEALNAFLNYDFETVDRIYKEVEEELKSDDDIAKLYLDKAKRVLDADATEVDRIYEAADIAYRKGSDNPEIVKELYIIYGLLGDKEKADEMNDTLIELGVDIDEEEDAEKEDDEKVDAEKEDTKKEDDSKKEDEKSKDTDSTKESDKKTKSNEQAD